MRTIIARLRNIKQTPTNGLAVFCGLVNPNTISLQGDGDAELMDGDDSSSSADNSHVDLKRICVIIEPPLNPIPSNLYFCDDCFHVDQLRDQLQDYSAGKKYGFIVITGQGSLFGTLRGSVSTVLHEFSVDLPKKHSKGGQSRERFARNREIARNEYLVQIAEKANQLFISHSQNTPNVTAIILAGTAELKNELISLKSDALDYRLRNNIATIVDVAYGGKMGFYQAISLAESFIANAKFVEEQEIINGLFTLLSKGHKVVVGINETMFAIRNGWVEKLVVCENLTNLKRVTFEDGSIQCLDEAVLKQMMKQDTLGMEGRAVKVEKFVDYLIDNYEKMGIDSLDLVTDATTEGTMFVNAFGGVGAVLKFEVDVPALLAEETQNTSSNYETFDEEAYEEDLSEFY